MSFVEAFGKALNAEFKLFIPMILPPLLRVFDGKLGDRDKTANTHMKIFDAFLTFCANIEEYLQFVIPLIVKTYECQDTSGTFLRKKAIRTIEGLTRRINFSDHASRITHPLVRVLNAGNKLPPAVLGTLCALVLQLGSDFAIFDPTICKVRAIQ